MKLFIWTDEHSYTAFAHCDTVARHAIFCARRSADMMAHVRSVRRPARTSKTSRPLFTMDELLTSD